MTWKAERAGVVTRLKRSKVITFEDDDYKKVIAF